MKNSLFIAELKHIFTNRKRFIPLLAILFVPILYAGMFLWSFWDPYEKLSDLPVAVVNGDSGYNYEDEQLTLGDDLVSNLKDNDSFNFHFVSQKEAYRDLENQKYYMVVEIPENFSQNASTLMDEQPDKLELKYVPNEGYNFLSAQIGETAVNEIKSSISKEITSTYAETMFGKVDEMANGLVKASNGAGDLEDGAAKLTDGSTDLKNHLEELASKSVDFQAGLQGASSGTEELANGANELSTGMTQLSDASDQLLNASMDVQSGSGQVADGASKTRAGLTELDQKTPALIESTDQVAAGIQQLQQELPAQIASQASAELTAGIEEVSAGLDELQPQLTAPLAEKVTEEAAARQEAQLGQLADVLSENGVDQDTIDAVIQQQKQNAPSREEIENQVAEAVDSGLTEGTSSLGSTLSQEAAGIEEQIQSQIQTAIDPAFNQLHDGVIQLNEGQKSLQNGIHQLAVGAEELENGSAKLASGQNSYVENMQTFNQRVNDADSGARKLAGGSNELNIGLNELSGGGQKLTNGVHDLADGSASLANGNTELLNGTKTLHDKLADAGDQASGVKGTSDTYDMFANPVNVEKEPINHVANYGTGFAPYFISLGLFVGGLLVTIVFTINKPAVKPRNGFTWFTGKFGIIASVGIIQALLTDAILLFGLGMEVTSVPYFILVSIVTSITFMTLIQFLVTVFGDPGRFVAILILILQLTTSAGTFPVELIPNLLQPINALLPMTYTVQAFKSVISSGDVQFMWSNIAILLTYTAVFMALTTAYFVIKHKKSSDLGAEIN
ncbi:YhgE/Pip domain-containing protein [Jeotgalibacillus sp. S-D1]|uniref:YhgE/Pip domain-containing protein n=1 Tax=Jeotgalibacillus sp. S-D1 TaxID=2552189 RepID=UPI0010596459|nr:YhgE/Pip domain-containing protein [Jeotgalibacillus sp. S-D1]TDL31307.1 YhgE/Pip domain-containing protein [Jeotgalibacillus sp. S-D1]